MVKSKEHGLPFCAEMIQAFLDGRKPMTRRLQGLKRINEFPYGWELVGRIENSLMWQFCNKVEGYTFDVKCPYAVGDRMYAKETHAVEKRLDHLTASEIGNAATVGIWYKVEDTQMDRPNQIRGRWRSSMFMPKWAARIWREITAIRCERLQDITEEDAKAEGCIADFEVVYLHDQEDYKGGYGRDHFQDLWDKLNGKKHPWARNDWVWVLSLKEVKK